MAERDELRLRLARVWVRELADDDRARPLLETVRAARGAVPEVAEPLAEILERTDGADADRELATLCHDVLARVDERARSAGPGASASRRSRRAWATSTRPRRAIAPPSSTRRAIRISRTR